MQSSFKSLILAGLLASAGFTTLAQTATPATPDAPMAGANGPARHHGDWGMRGAMDPARMEAMVARHHAALKAKLKLAPEQEAAWTTFTTAMRPPAPMEHARPDPAEMAKLTTPERIDRMHALRAQHMADMNAAMDKRDDATKAFYAVLNDEQKKVFDAAHARMGDHHGEQHGRRGADKPAAK